LNLLAARVVLRPRSLADVLDLALPLCLANLRPLLTLAAAALAPIGVLAAALRLRGHWGWVPLWALVGELSFVSEGLFTLAFGELLFQEPAEIRPAALVRSFAGRLGAYVYMVVGRQVLLAVSATLVFAPFLHGPATLFAGDALLLERSSPAKARGRSRALAHNRNPFCLGLWLATLALPLLGAVIGDQLGNAVVGFVFQLGKPTGDLLTQGGSGFAVAGALLAAPVAAAARFLGYIDLRTRKEGWDIQLRFLAIAADGANGKRRAA
jgi:hypothetical protein